MRGARGALAHPVPIPLSHIHILKLLNFKIKKLSKPIGYIIHSAKDAHVPPKAGIGQIPKKQGAQEFARSGQYSAATGGM